MCRLGAHPVARHGALNAERRERNRLATEVEEDGAGGFEDTELAAVAAGRDRFPVHHYPRRVIVSNR